MDKVSCFLFSISVLLLLIMIWVDAGSPDDYVIREGTVVESACVAYKHGKYIKTDCSIRIQWNDNGEVTLEVLKIGLLNGEEVVEVASPKNPRHPTDKYRSYITRKNSFNLEK